MFGVMHATVCVTVAVGMGGDVVGEDENGDANSTTKIVGMGEGVAGRGGADVSEKASEIPPITSNNDIAPMMNPLPIWRRACMVIYPNLFSWRAAIIR